MERISERVDLFDPEEMRSFGLDPDNDADRQEWLNTTPPNGIPAVTDYSEDRWAYGPSDEQVAEPQAS